MIDEDPQQGGHQELRGGHDGGLARVYRREGTAQQSRPMPREPIQKVPLASRSVRRYSPEMGRARTAQNRMV